MPLPRNLKCADYFLIAASPRATLLPVYALASANSASRPRLRRLPRGLGRGARKPQVPRRGRAVSGRRYYSPSQGRFIGRDPKAELGGSNLYSFVRNSPINLWDYLGMLAPSTIQTGITSPSGQATTQTMWWRNGPYGFGYYSTPGPSGGWLDPDIHTGSPQSVDDGTYLGASEDEAYAYANDDICDKYADHLGTLNSDVRVISSKLLAHKSKLEPVIQALDDGYLDLTKGGLEGMATLAETLFGIYQRRKANAAVGTAQFSMNISVNITWNLAEAYQEGGAEGLGTAIGALTDAVDVGAHVIKVLVGSEGKLLGKVASAVGVAGNAILVYDVMSAVEKVAKGYKVLGELSSDLKAEGAALERDYSALNNQIGNLQDAMSVRCK